MGERARVSIWVDGKVQGVGFRYFVQAEAASHRLTGYVKNLPDGRVEIDLEGKKKDLEKIIEWIRIGPPGSRVSDLRLSWDDYDGKYGDFSIRF